MQHALIYICKSDKDSVWLLPSQDSIMGRSSLLEAYANWDVQLVWKSVHVIRSMYKTLLLEAIKLFDQCLDA
jgi:hypothetical protein